MSNSTPVLLFAFLYLYFHLFLTTHASDVRSPLPSSNDMQQSHSQSRPMTIEPIQQSTASSSIRSIKVQAMEHNLEIKTKSIAHSLLQTRKILALVRNDVMGGGAWASDAITYTQAASTLIDKGSATFDASVKTSQAASTCAEACHDDECMRCENSSPSLDGLISLSKQQLTTSHESFIQAKTAIEVTKQSLLTQKTKEEEGEGEGEGEELGEIIELARRSAATSCGELEKWLDILVEITALFEDQVHRLPNVVAQKQVTELNRVIEKRKKLMKQSASFRGASEEKRKTMLASKIHVQLQKEDVLRRSPQQCEQLFHCRDSMWLKPELEIDGCIHGCRIHPSMKETCDQKCNNVRANLFQAVDVEQKDQDAFVRGCRNSCTGTLKNQQQPPKLANWRQDALGDTVVVPHDIQILRLDDVPLQRGHGFRCNETTVWKPCFDTCDGVHGHGKSIKRSGCIYGCRIVLVKSIPSSSDCNQYCDEVVDQVLKNVQLYGNESLTKSEESKEQKQQQWSETCADSCIGTFELRSKSGFDMHTNDNTTPC